MVNPGELLVNVVRKEQAKGAERLEPTGNVAGTRAVTSRVMGDRRYRRTERT